MPTVSLAPVLRQRFFDANGEPLAGGKVFTYQSGTTTPQVTYTDFTGTVPNANPVILDANGEADIWFDQSLSYKVILTDLNDVQQWETDGVIGILTSGSVGTNALQDGAVTTPKIADGAVTTAKIADEAVTNAKLSNMNAFTIKGNNTNAPASPIDLSVIQTQEMIGVFQTHQFQANGPYSDALSFPQNFVDGLLVFKEDAKIINIIIYNLQNGSSGTTEFDLKVGSNISAYSSILSTTGKINATTALSITFSGALATATLNDHGFVNGDSVTISGSTPTEYNGTFVISAVTENTFQYTMSGTPSGNSSGAVIATKSNVFTDSGSAVGALAGVVKPVISSPDVNAGDSLRFDILTTITGASDCGVIVQYSKR